MVSLSDQQNIPVTCTELEQMTKAGFQEQFLELELGLLEPGEYVLYIVAQDSSTKESSYGRTTLVVR